jgi:hypothetical protein
VLISFPSSTAIAAPTAEGKEFKIAIDTTRGAMSRTGVKAAKTGTTVYLTSTGSSKSPAGALVCSLSNGNSGELSCGGKQFWVNLSHTAEALTPSSKPLGPYYTGTWKIGADNVLSWHVGKTEIQLSTKSVASTTIYAEVCSTSEHLDGSMFYPGVAKAVFV